MFVGWFVKITYPLLDSGFQKELVWSPGVGTAVGTGDVVGNHNKMIYKWYTFFISWQSLRLDETSKGFNLEEGMADRKLLLDIPDNRPTSALFVGFTPFYFPWVWSYLPHPLSAGAFLCQSPALFTQFICLCRSTELGGARAELLCSLKAESQTHPNVELEPPLPSAGGHSGPGVKVQVGTSTAVWGRHFLNARLILWSFWKGTCPLFSSGGPDHPLPDKGHCSEVGDGHQGHGTIWQTVLLLQM